MLASKQKKKSNFESHNKTDSNQLHFESKLIRTIDVIIDHYLDRLKHLALFGLKRGNWDWVGGRPDSASLIPTKMQLD